MLRGGGKLLHSLGFRRFPYWNNYHNPNFLFVIASVSEAISNKLKDCHVAIAPRNDARRNVAFTLAEVLITLGIIGIVSAMTIPTLITKNQKMIIEKRITQDYSIINQALRLQTNDGLDITSETVPDYDTQAIKSWYDKYWAPFLKTSKVCYNTTGCWINTRCPKTISGANSNTSIGYGSHVIVVLENGTTISMDLFGTSGGGMAIFGVPTSYDFMVMYVDANGASLPNVVGKDIYVFVVTREKGLVPAGYSKTPAEIRANCSKNATGSLAGYFCLSRVKLDGWKILDEVWDAKT